MHHGSSDSEELWIGICCLSGICAVDCKCLSICVYIYLCRDKRINDAEEYIMAVKQREGERKAM